MNTLRRVLLKSAGASGAIGALFIAGLLKPARAFADNLQRQAFSATSFNQALKSYGAERSVESRDILISAAEISENGSQVPVEITSNIPGNQTIAVFVEKNPIPLAASISFANGALPYTRIQLKMAESSRIRVVVKTADGEIYHASREIKVTLGGCG